MTVRMPVHKLDKRSTQVAVNTDDVRAFIRDLRKASPAAVRGVRGAVKGAAEIVAVEAKAIVSEHSKSIPPTIKARTYLSGGKGATATVTAGKGVPLAALYELGNKGRSPAAETFRHPVFERNAATGRLQQTEDWVDQDRYPYLLPAAERKGAEIQQAVEKVADVVADIVAVRRL